MHYFCPSHVQRGLDDCYISPHTSSHMYNAPRFRLLQLSVKLPSFPFICAQVFCEITKRHFVCVFTRFKWLWVFSHYSCTCTSVHNEGACIICMFYHGTGKWSSPAVTGTNPPPLAHFSFTKVSGRNAVVYGGLTAERNTSDVYVLDLDKLVHK